MLLYGDCNVGSNCFVSRSSCYSLGFADLIPVYTFASPVPCNAAPCTPASCELHVDGLCGGVTYCDVPALEGDDLFVESVMSYDL